MPQPSETRSSTPQSLRLPRGRAYDPFEHADLLGVQVIFRRIRTANELWMPEFNTLVIKDGMRAVHQRNAAAHGVEHAALAHPDDRPKYEAQADRMAAVYLIDPAELRDISRWADGDQALIAEELGVTRRLLAAYRSA